MDLGEAHQSGEPVPMPPDYRVSDGFDFGPDSPHPRLWATVTASYRRHQEALKNDYMRGHFQGMLDACADATGLPVDHFRRLVHEAFLRGEGQPSGPYLRP